MSAPMMRAADLHRLLQNDLRQRPVRGTRGEIDHVPVVMLHLPFSACRWLLSEVDNDDQDIAFGLCDLGLGFPELGSVYLPELKSLRHGPLRVIPDTRLTITKPLSWWTREAQRHSSLAAVEEPAS